MQKEQIVSNDSNTGRLTALQQISFETSVLRRIAAKMELHTSSKSFFRRKGNVQIWTERYNIDFVFYFSPENQHFCASQKMVLDSRAL